MVHGFGMVSERGKCAGGSSGECVPALVRKAADQPVRLDGVVEPGLRETVPDAALDRALADLLAVPVEEWKLAARLFQPACEPGALGAREDAALLGSPVTARAVRLQRHHVALVR